MDLHRTSNVPEWVEVPAVRRNSWQRVASRTYGVVTIGNFLSIIGLLSIPYGLSLVHQGRFVPAAAVLGIGRIFDLLDGWAADRTGTKSPLGEKIDASFDKVSTGAVVLGLMVLGVLPVAVVIILVAPHAVIAVLVLAAFVKGRQFHPSRAGKFSMALLWAVILMYVLAAASDGSVAHAVRSMAGVVLSAATILGIAALAGYSRELLQDRK